MSSIPRPSSPLHAPCRSCTNLLLIFIIYLWMFACSPSCQEFSSLPSLPDSVNHHCRLIIDTIQSSLQIHHRHYLLDAVLGPTLLPLPAREPMLNPTASAPVLPLQPQSYKRKGGGILTHSSIPREFYVTCPHHLCWGFDSKICTFWFCMEWSNFLQERWSCYFPLEGSAMADSVHWTKSVSYLS